MTEEERKELERLLNKLLIHLDDEQYDTVLDVLDWLTGWCSPHLRIP
jgi:hypothetical protein